MGLIDAILTPLEYVVAWIMVAWHKGLTIIGLPATAGITWALSIVGLVIVIRILLIPSLFQQIKASRGVQRQAGYLPRPGIQCCGEAASPPNAATNRAHDRRLDGLIRPSRTPACPGPRADDRRGYR
jgi:hypothetical protein